MRHGAGEADHSLGRRGSPWWRARRAVPPWGDSTWRMPRRWCWTRRRWWSAGAGTRNGCVADAAPLVLDVQAVVVRWGRDAERLLGYAAAEVLGRSAAELLAGDDAARLPELRERCRRDGGWAGPVSVRRRDGCPLAVMVRVVPVLERGGSPRRVALVAGMAGAAGWDMSRAVLERMVEHSPLGIAVVDTDLRFVWSNAALEQYGGGPAAGRIGRRLAEIQPGLATKAIEAQMRRVLETGDPVVAHEHVGRIRSSPHRETAHAMSFTRLDDDLGHPIGVSYTVVDVTEGYRARTRLALLDRAGQHIGSTLDVTRTAQELADVAVPELADFVAVDLVESVLSGGEPAPGAGTVALRRAGHQSVNDGVPEAVVAVGDVARYLAGSPPRALSDQRRVVACGTPGSAREGVGDQHTGRPGSHVPRTRPAQRDDRADACTRRHPGSGHVLPAPPPGNLRRGRPQPGGRSRGPCGRVRGQRPPLHPGTAPGPGAPARPAAAPPARPERRRGRRLLPAGRRTDRPGRRLVRRHPAVRGPRRPGGGGGARPRHRRGRRDGPAAQRRPDTRRPGPAARRGPRPPRRPGRQSRARARQRHSRSQRHSRPRTAGDRDELPLRGVRPGHRAVRDGHRGPSRSAGRRPGRHGRPHRPPPRPGPRHRRSAVRGRRAHPGRGQRPRPPHRRPARRRDDPPR